jgi:NTE family protein
LSNRSFTLVLGGGAMKGLAHVGVLAALEELGLRPVDIVGSSVGALIGAAWSTGMSADDLRTVALELERKDLFRVASGDMARYGFQTRALYLKAPLAHLLDGLLGDITFDQLTLPVLVNTVDVNSGTQVLWGATGLTDVRVADAVYASCALPGYLPPMEIHGRFFVDGAAAANLPLHIGSSRERDMIIAVDVGSTRGMRSNMEHSSFAILYARAVEIGLGGMRDAALRHWGSPPLLLIQPRVGHISMFSFSHNQALVDEGYRAARQLLTDPTAIPPPGGSGVYPRRSVRVEVDQEKCIGCGTCVSMAPQVFHLDGGGKAKATQAKQTWSASDTTVIRA